MFLKQMSRALVVLRCESMFQLVISWFTRRPVVRFTARMNFNGPKKCHMFHSLRSARCRALCASPETPPSGSVLPPALTDALHVAPPSLQWHARPRLNFLRCSEATTFALGKAEVTAAGWFCMRELEGRMKKGDSTLVPMTATFQHAFFRELRGEYRCGG